METTNNKHRFKRAYARRVRAAVMAALGDSCAACGTRDKIEVDHINGRPYKLSALGRDQRATLLRKELARGEIQLLCRSCNAHKQ